MPRIVNPAPQDPADLGLWLLAKIQDVLDEHEVLKLTEAVREIPNGLQWGEAGSRQQIWWESPRAAEQSLPTRIRVRLLSELVPTADSHQEAEAVEAQLRITSSALYGGLIAAPEFEGSLAIAAACTVPTEHAESMSTLLVMALAAHRELIHSIFEPHEGQPLLDRLTLPFFSEDPEEVLPTDSDDSSEEPEKEDLYKVIEAEGYELVDFLKSIHSWNFQCIEGVFVMEFPFMSEPARLSIDLSADHPIFGSSLLLSLALPAPGKRNRDLLKNLYYMNASEQVASSVHWAFGSWCPGEPSDPRPTCHCWIPHDWFMKTTLMDMTMAMLMRAEYWCDKIGHGRFFASLDDPESAALVQYLEPFIGLLQPEDQS